MFPCLSPLHGLATLAGAGEVTSRIIEVAAVQAEAGVPEGFFLRGVLLTDIWTGRTAGDILSKPEITFSLLVHKNKRGRMLIKNNVYEQFSSLHVVKHDSITSPSIH